MRAFLVVFAFSLGACAFAFGQSQALTGQASVSLTNANAAAIQTSDHAWTLSKTGSVDTANHVVTWTITATQVATTPGQLIVEGFMMVTNNGALGATIGNIAVNLQTRVGGSWVTSSSDIADGTHGSSATVANIDSHASSEGLSWFATNAASGKLQFMDATNNSMFSLVPEVTIAGGTTVIKTGSPLLARNHATYS